MTTGNYRAQTVAFEHEMLKKRIKKRTSNTARTSHTAGFSVYEERAGEPRQNRKNRQKGTL